MSDTKEFVIIYHPTCPASCKLLKMITDDKMFRLINVLNISELPSDLKCVPAGITADGIITGKKLFDKVESMMNGPIGLNVYEASNNTAFIHDSCNFNLNSNYTKLDNNQSDGFTGIPEFDECNTKTVSQLELERE